MIVTLLLIVVIELGILVGLELAPKVARLRMAPVIPQIRIEGLSAAPSDSVVLVLYDDAGKRRHEIHIQGDAPDEIEQWGVKYQRGQLVNGEYHYTEA